MTVETCRKALAQFPGNLPDDTIANYLLNDTVLCVGSVPTTGNINACQVTLKIIQPLWLFDSSVPTIIRYRRLKKVAI